jgi:hypothetical protein
MLFQWKCSSSAAHCSSRSCSADQRARLVALPVTRADVDQILKGAKHPTICRLSSSPSSSVSSTSRPAKTLGIEIAQRCPRTPTMISSGIVLRCERLTTRAIAGMTPQGIITESFPTILPVSLARCASASWSSEYVAASFTATFSSTKNPACEEDRP